MTVPVVHELQEFRGKVRVFRDREHAGEVQSGMLKGFRESRGIIFALPAGGVPVAAVIARKLGLPLDVAVVSKILLPWDTEAGYGAVAFDGTVRLNTTLVDSLQLEESTVAEGVAATRHKVERRVRLFRGDRLFPDLAGRPVILVDDGLASGFTMLVAVEAMRNRGADRIVVAAPTGYAAAVDRICRESTAIYCANIRDGRPFAVADAYRLWTDVREEEALEILARVIHERPQQEPCNGL